MITNCFFFAFVSYHELLFDSLCYPTAARFKFLVFVMDCVFVFVITLCYLFVVDSFIGISLLTAILGALHQAWFGIIWTLIYELFPGKDAATVSGFFFFACGVTTFIAPAGISAILSSTKSIVDDFGAFAKAGRSFGNRIVLLFLLVLMAMGILLQGGIYLAVRRDEQKKVLSPDKAAS